MDGSAAAKSRGREVLLTGATGFVGKVVLEALLRRREELDIARVYLLIRPSTRKDRAPRERFRLEVETSPCFRELPAGWSDFVEIVEGDISRHSCGLTPESRAQLTGVITHVLHVAASIEFDLPIAEALSINTHGCMNMLELAREATNLVQMVAVSTAYVTPGRDDGGPVEEVLAPLPRPAQQLHDEILAGTVDEAELLKATGHPNTYTLTKCLAEHLIVERHDRVPLRIVRPSIVSASWHEPFPGWIDSRAAFAAFVALAGGGYLRAIAGQPDARIDLVPVDVVAQCIIRAAFEDNVPVEGDGDNPVVIHHAVAGLAHSATASECRHQVVDFFRRYPLDRWPDAPYLGPLGFRFALADGRHHSMRLPISALIVGRGWRAGTRLLGKIRNFNRVFFYFINHTFDFRAAASVNDPRPDPIEYMEIACHGIYHHLLRRKDSEIPLAGRRGPDRKGDMRFVHRQPEGTTLARITAWFVAKALRRSTDMVSFDLSSFERAKAELSATHPGATLVLVPSHRSYLDFVLVSFLCFARHD
ncbi:MAG: SDR family oxidoreductase, partial [Thermoleophilia bacterium]|nr:SDR family oxidoreductase [Thermoleophilia bacterium]